MPQRDGIVFKVYSGAVQDTGSCNPQTLERCSHSLRWASIRGTPVHQLHVLRMVLPCSGCLHVSNVQDTGIRVCKAVAIGFALRRDLRSNGLSCVFVWVGLFMSLSHWGITHMRAEWLAVHVCMERAATSAVRCGLRVMHCQ